MIRLRAFWRLLKLTVSKWQDDNVSWLSAALAYYTLFSLAPTVILVVSIGGTIFGEEAVAGEVVLRVAVKRSILSQWRNGPAPKALTRRQYSAPAGRLPGIRGRYLAIISACILSGQRQP